MMNFKKYRNGTIAISPHAMEGRDSLGARFLRAWGLRNVEKYKEDTTAWRQVNAGQSGGKGCQTVKYMSKFCRGCGCDMGTLGFYLCHKCSDAKPDTCMLCYKNHRMSNMFIQCRACYIAMWGPCPHCGGPLFGGYRCMDKGTPKCGSNTPSTEAVRRAGRKSLGLNEPIHKWCGGCGGIRQRVAGSDVWSCITCGLDDNDDGEGIWVDPGIRITPHRVKFKRARPNFVQEMIADATGGFKPGDWI